MPPHKQLSGQVFCPMNFEEYCSTRRSGTKDHTWKRVKGPIQQKPTLLPFWMLIFNSGCEPIRLMLTHFIDGHLLVKVASEDKQNHSITYKWYAPDYNYTFRSAKELWATTKLEYGMFLQFCKHRLSHQKLLVQEGWTRLKANSEFADRLTDAMFAELMSAAGKLKSLIKQVTTATEKGELISLPMPK